MRTIDHTVPTEGDGIRICDIEECWLESWQDLPPEAHAEFDYLDTPEKQDEAVFFRYGGTWFDLGEFMRFGSGGPLWKDGWQAARNDTWASGTLVKLIEEGPDAGDKLVAAFYY